MYPEQRRDKARNAHPLRTRPLAGIIRAEVLATVAAHLEAVRGDGTDCAPCHGVTCAGRQSWRAMLARSTSRRG